MSLIHVRLARDSYQTPWGFRLQGGKDLKQPLTVQRVFTNTPSEGELQRGDVILSINGRDTSSQTHKQAQDIISKGGGQIEFLVQRPPPGQVHIKPLTPTIDTRAPSFPQTPTKSPQINIPIRRKSGPHLPRTIPVSPQKPAPPQPSPKPTRSRDDMSVGFTPKKVTLSKYGGGTHSFGSGPPTPKAYQSVAPPQPQSQPQYRPAPARAHAPAPAPEPVYRAPTHAPARAPEPVYRAPPEEPQHYHSLPVQHSQSDQQGERGVDEETYGNVSERRRNFMSTQQTQQYVAADEYDYPTEPVWERRKIFFSKKSQPRAVKRSHKPVPTYGQVRGGDVVDYGVSYGKPQAYQKPSSPTKSAPRPRPPAVNASSREDQSDPDWSSTLRNEGSSSKIWEREQALLDQYQAAPAHDPFRPSEAPNTQAPKPKTVQITTQSTVRPPQGHRSVSPAVGPKPAKSHSRSPVPPHYSNAPRTGVTGNQQKEGANIVHLQYNSPMGLYSNANIQDTYIGQTQSRAPTKVSEPEQPVPFGRDWSNSYVYKMVNEDTTSTRQEYPGSGEAPQGSSVTTTRTTTETKHPGQSPHRTVKETVSRRGPNAALSYNEELGMSDF